MSGNNSELEKRVFNKIDELESELIKVALDLGDMDTSQPQEIIAGDYVYNWMIDNGFAPKKIGLPERFNVLGKYEGTGKGCSLLFNSHLDNESRESVEYRIKDYEDPIYTRAWQEGDTLVGHGIANDRGPMACWMIAVKAIKDLGIELTGDVLLTAVVGETGGSPIDEFESPKYDSHELGARYVATHGGLADFACIAEATAFSIVPVECGFAYFKVTLFAGPASYTPFYPYPEESMEKSVNAIVRMAKFIERYQEYAFEYQKKNTYTMDEGSTVVPKTVIGAIRGGLPFIPHITPEVCSIYIDFRVPPGGKPLGLQRDLKGLLEDMDLNGKVEMYKYLPGYEACNIEGYDVLRESIEKSHMKIIKEPPRKSVSYMTSMWRDINIYNELGVPAISYGFPTQYTEDNAKYDISFFRVKIEDMVKSAKVYSSLVLDICNRQQF